MLTLLSVPFQCRGMCIVSLRALVNWYAIVVVIECNVKNKTENGSFTLH